MALTSGFRSITMLLLLALIVVSSSQSALSQKFPPGRFVAQQKILYQYRYCPNTCGYYCSRNCRNLGYTDSYCSQHSSWGSNCSPPAYLYQCYCI